MYVADSRSSKAPVAPAETRPGRREAADGSGPADGSGAGDGPRAAAGRRTAVRAAVPGTVVALGVVSLVTDVSSEMVSAVLPLYLLTGLGLSPLGFGLLDGIQNGFSALVRLLGGHLADRRGRDGAPRHKAVAAVGYGLSALCKPLLLLVHTVPLIGAVVAVDRTGKGLRTAPRDAMISLATEPAHRGRAFGVHRAMDTAGALLGPLTAFLVLRLAGGPMLADGGQQQGYHAVFAVSGCVAVLGVLVLLLFVPNRLDAAGTPDGAGPSSDAAGVSDARPRLRDGLALLRVPGLRRLTVCAVLLGLTTVSDSFLYLLVQRRLGLSVEYFPLLPLGTAGAFLLLAVPLGALADRIGRRRLFLAGHGVLLLAYGLLLSPLDGPAAVVCVLLLHGSFYAATDGVLAAAAADTVPAERRGAGLALVGTGQALARFACSLAFGALWSAVGGTTALTWSALALAGCVTGAAFVLREPAAATGIPGGPATSTTDDSEVPS
ncbi:MFS transporter [Kitasatospora purpeofusca]|uniref:MFS transporter n=1 Tax=Kitasatospora purpeofusca TaxID=67352 RepID=UPI002255342D|nr:MFS transporter [Kitasatospora purpeofusca]MCX4757387.1 MFS transporter [Kitasatospora purpeofusca]WSR34874.1 MFS transporter [Kitasatospora purpeofusca]